LKELKFTAQILSTMKRLLSWSLIFFIFKISASEAQDFQGINPEHLPSGKFDFSKPVINTILLSSNVRLEYAEQGNPNGVAVIFLHGYTDSWHSFEKVMSYLPASIHVYSISLRGHGNSSKPERGYHPDDFAKDIADFIQQLDIKNPVLLGHSMGSSVVQSFISKYPLTASGIILAGAFADYDNPELKDFKQKIDRLSDPVDSIFAAEFQKSTAYRPVSGAMMKLFIEESMKLPAYVWKGVAAGWSSSGYTSQLTNYKSPALLIWGNKDNFISKKEQEKLQLCLLNSTLKIYEETGHAIHWEQPERFAKDVVAFVAGLNMTALRSPIEH
jgi:non-heme chloroperoxidase